MSKRLVGKPLGEDEQELPMPAPKRDRKKSGERGVGAFSASARGKQGWAAGGGHALRGRVAGQRKGAGDEGLPMPAPSPKRAKPVDEGLPVPSGSSGSAPSASSAGSVDEGKCPESRDL